jgi:hypothetical protein
MRSLPPPFPAEQTAPRHALGPVLLRLSGVVLLAAGGVALGAFVLPTLRRPAPEPESVAAAEPSLPKPVRVPELRQHVPPESPAAPPAAEQVEAVAPAPAKEPPPVTPVLPSRTGPYALALRIDREIDAKLAEAKLPASPLASDAEFVRRAHLDLHGRIPTAARTVAFLQDPEPTKRAKLIDELLDDPVYGRHFARLWADALVKRDFDSNRGLETGAFTAWLAERFNTGAGWDQIVRDMVTATGKEQESPPTFFVLANMDNRQPSPAKLTGAVGNLFLGVQIQCAECHKHPHNDRWDVNDFWGVAAFFAHTKAQRSGPNAKPKNQAGPATITEVEQAAAPKDKKGKPLAPAARPGLVINVPDPNDPRKVIRTARGKFFEGAAVAEPGRAPYRPRLAAWLTSADNRYFGPAAVNRLWAHVFGRGLVHPVEDMGGQNTPTHQELLRELAAAFVASKYDVKFLLRAICNSAAYGRTSRPVGENANDDRLCSRMPVKVLDARQLVDSLFVATGREMKFPRAPVEGRKGVRDAADPLVRFLDTRDYDDDPTEFSYGIPQLLRLMNTGLTAASAEKARQLTRKHNGDHAAVIEEIFLTALSRRPTAAEMRRMRAYLRKEPARGYAGVLWALLNCAEFVSNH